MLARPLSEDENLIKILKLCRKFNKTLEELLYYENKVYIMTLTSMTENSFFYPTGMLTKSGQLQLWAEINHIMKKFESDPDQEMMKAMIPKKHNMNNQHHRKNSPKRDTDRYHWYARRKLHLPTPPPKKKSRF